eukprot:3921783-Amphidinium_carterae.1
MRKYLPLLLGFLPAAPLESSKYCTGVSLLIGSSFSDCFPGLWLSFLQLGVERFQDSDVGTGRIRQSEMGRRTFSFLGLLLLQQLVIAVAFLPAPVEDPTLSVVSNLESPSSSHLVLGVCGHVTSLQLGFDVSAQEINCSWSGKGLQVTWLPPVPAVWRAAPDYYEVQ